MNCDVNEVSSEVVVDNVDSLQFGVMYKIDDNNSWRGLIVTPVFQFLDDEEDGEDVHPDDSVLFVLNRTENRDFYNWAAICYEEALKLKRFIRLPSGSSVSLVQA